MPKLTAEQIDGLDRLFASFRVEVSVAVASPPERVWDLISDVTRIGEFSLEATGARWVEGANGPAVGSRFVGENKVGELEWARVCTVTAAQRPTKFAYVVGDRFDGSATGCWTYDLVSENGATTTVIERFEHEPAGRSGVRLRAERDPSRANEIVSARMKYLKENMLLTLEAMRGVLEAPEDVPAPKR